MEASDWRVALEPGWPHSPTWVMTTIRKSPPFFSRARQWLPSSLFCVLRKQQHWSPHKHPAQLSAPKSRLITPDSPVPLLAISQVDPSATSGRRLQFQVDAEQARRLSLLQHDHRSPVSTSTLLPSTTRPFGEQRLNPPIQKLFLQHLDGF